MNKIIGALWKREKNGMEYLSGILSDLRGNINVAVFPNTYKTEEYQPDYNIVISFDNEKKEKQRKKEISRENDDEPTF